MQREVEHVSHSGALLARTHRIHQGIRSRRHLSYVEHDSRHISYRTAHWHILWGADPRTAWHIAMGSRPENCMAHGHGATISRLSTPYWHPSWGAGPRTAWHTAMGSRPKDCMARSHGAIILTLSLLMCSAAGAGTQLTPLLTYREALWGADPRTAWLMTIARRFCCFHS